MKLALTILFLSASWIGLAQNQSDRRGFQGTIVSSLTTIVDSESGDVDTQDNEETVITFSARSISIGRETFDIITREFDGQRTTTFNCNLRRGTFMIVFLADESISLIDQESKEVTTVYAPLSIN